MNHKKKWILVAVLTVIAIAIHLFSVNMFRVERYYSNGFYPYMAIFLRGLLGWIPCSLGDILYGLTGLYLVIKTVRFLKRVFKWHFPRGWFLQHLQGIMIKLLIIYIVFNIFWGINYNRVGIAGQLNLPMEKYSMTELKALNAQLLQKVNESKSVLLRQPPPVLSNSELFEHSEQAYQILQKQYPYLNDRPRSVKSSLWGWLGNYIGFSGYYNPFTGESQVNTTVPKFLQPFVTCHEIAHQLGYAKENEANFVGYLAASASADEFFHYSVYLDLFIYANRNLFFTDSTAARELAKGLAPSVRQDLEEWRRFERSHQNPVEPVIRWAYGNYLKGNQQPSGELSYDEVTGFMIAYYKKFGRL